MRYYVKITNDNIIFIATIDLLVISSHMMEAWELLYVQQLNQVLDQFLVD